MVRPLRDHDAVGARDDTSDLDGEIVRFGTRAHEEAHAEFAAEQRTKTFGQAHDLVVQIPGVRVEQSGLRADRLDDPWMTVPDRGNVVVAVEQLIPVNVDDPDALAANEVDRVVVEQLVGRGECLRAPPQQLLIGHRFSLARTCWR